MRVLSRSEKRIAGKPAVWAELRADTEQGVTDVLLHMILLLNHFLTNVLIPEVFTVAIPEVLSQKIINQYEKTNAFVGVFFRGFRFGPHGL